MSDTGSGSMYLLEVANDGISENMEVTEVVYPVTDASILMSEDCNS